MLRHTHRQGYAHKHTKLLFTTFLVKPISAFTVTTISKLLSQIKTVYSWAHKVIHWQSTRHAQGPRFGVSIKNKIS